MLVQGRPPDVRPAPNVITRAAVIGACCERHLADRAWLLLVLMLVQGLAPNVITRANMICTCCAAPVGRQSLAALGVETSARTRAGCDHLCSSDRCLLYEPRGRESLSALRGDASTRTLARCDHLHLSVQCLLYEPVGRQSLAARWEMLVQWTPTRYDHLRSSDMWLR